MTDPAQRVREALEAYRRDEAATLRASSRPGSAPGRAALCARHAWLRSRAAEDALGEAAERGRLVGDELAATRAHVASLSRATGEAAALDALEAAAARVEVDSQPLDARELASRVGAHPDARVRARAAEALERLLASAVGRLEDARRRALEIEEPEHPDRDPPGLLDDAAAFLAGTEDLAREIVAWSSRAGAPWQDLLHGMREPAVDGLFPARERYRRIAADFAGLGLEAALRRLSVEAPRRWPWPEVAIVAVDPPRVVGLQPVAVELGLIGEVLALEGFGRALALALAAPALPAALRWPVTGSASRAAGALLSQCLPEQALLRGRGLGRRDAERASRRAGAACVLLARARAAAALAWSRGAAREAVAAHLGCAVAEPLARLLAGPRAPVAFRAARAGLALAVALRELHDEDWFRNPRAGAAMRGGAERGGALSCEVWLSEVGGAPERAVDRAHELFPA